MAKSGKQAEQGSARGRAKHAYHTRPEPVRDGKIRCRNCGGYYDPKLPRCVYCGAETRDNPNAARALSSVADQGGGFSGEGEGLSRVSRLMVAGLIAVVVIAVAVAGGTAAWHSFQQHKSEQAAAAEAVSSTSQSAASSGAASSTASQSADASTQSTASPASSESSSAASSAQGGDAGTDTGTDKDQTETGTDQTDTDAAQATTETAAEKITLKYTDVTLKQDESLDLKATVTPTDWDGTVTWSSSDKTVAVVSDQGVVTQTGGGTCTVTASTGEKTASCIVRSTAGSSGKSGQAASGLTLNYADLTLNKPGDSVTLKVSGGSGSTFSSSNASVATVDSAGKIIAVGSGKCTITVTCGSKSAVCDVHVK